MFKKRTQIAEQNVTVIGKGTRVGALMTDSDVVVLGVINGDLTGGNITIHGTVEGNVTATGKVFLQSGSKITGEVTCVAIEIQEGTTFRNKLNVGPVDHVMGTEE